MIPAYHSVVSVSCAGAVAGTSKQVVPTLCIIPISDQNYIGQMPIWAWSNDRRIDGPD
jgi:hypothetical protein